MLGHRNLGYVYPVCYDDPRCELDITIRDKSEPVQLTLLKCLSSCRQRREGTQRHADAEFDLDYF